MRSILLCSAMILLPACDPGVRNRPRLQWAGQLAPLADPAQCPSTRGVLVMRDGQVVFSPDEGTWVLNGKASPAGIDVSRSRVTPDHKTYVTRLQAKWTQSSIEGVYTTPRCRYQVSLSAF